MAYFDALTGLSNRHAFRERFEYMVKESLRQRNQIALLFIDLDHFKRINDTYGHTFGDELLQQFSARLVKAVRETDDICLNSDVEGRADIARLGGDEFVIRLSKLDDAMLVATSVAERIRRAVKEPFEIDGHTIYITTSIGISIYPTDGHDTETLMRNADIAMYQAKAHGRNKFAFYTERTNTHAHIRLNLESELHAALEKELLDVYYQPIIDARTFAVTAAETLVRWLHPERGVIPAFEFISIAEEMGLITQIDDIVFRKACAQLAAWHQEGHKLERIFVNFSGNQFQKPDLVDYVSGILQEHNLTGRNLVIEITEGVLAESEKRLLDITQSLRDMGVRLAIDDFGTGYSSLSRLKNLALDKLKIDHSFVRGLGEDEESGALIKAIVAMARSLKMQVVAEGVETEIQLDRLLNYGVDCLQGYYFSPAVPAEEFVRLFGTGYAGRKLIAAS
jgi:diguanylate cyclase (GGDEF)-like protein